MKYSVEEEMLLFKEIAIKLSEDIKDFIWVDNITKNQIQIDSSKNAIALDAFAYVFSHYFASSYRFSPDSEWEVGLELSFKNLKKTMNDARKRENLWKPDGQ